MPASITSIEVYGFNGDPCDESGNKRVSFSSFDSDCPGNRRYNRLKANSLRIKGTDLADVQEIRLSSSTSTYDFAVIEDQMDDLDLIVWFLCWSSPRSLLPGKPREPITGGDLTVTIDTTPPAPTVTATDDDVDYE